MAEKKKKLSELEAPSVTDWIAQFGTGAVGPGDVQPMTRGLANLVGHTVESLATLPERALRAASGVRRGEYDPGPILETAMMGPVASAPFALRGAIDPAQLAALYLSKRKRPVHSGAEKGFEEFELLDEAGKRVGYTHITPGDKDLYIGNIGAYGVGPLEPTSRAYKANRGAYAFGPRDIRTLQMGLRHHFPEAETVSGYRMSGGRKAARAVDTKAVFDEAGNLVNARMPLPQFTNEQMQAYLAKTPQAPEPLPTVTRSPLRAAPRASESVPREVREGGWLQELLTRARQETPPAPSPEEQALLQIIRALRGE